MATSQDASSCALDHYRAGRLDEAERLGNEIVRATPRSAPALHLLGLIARDRGDHATAASFFAQAAEAAPEVAEHQLRLGEAARLSGQVPLAVASLERAVALDPRSAESQSALGTALVASGRRAEAIQRWLAAVAIDPSFSKAHNNLGSALLAEGDLAGAILRFETALALQPTSHLAHANLGNALRAVGRMDEAIASYGRALAIKPDYLPALNNLGSALRKQGELAAAVGHLRRATAVDPGGFEALNNLGTALLDAGEIDEARGCFERAIARKPGAFEAHDNLGTALLEQGRVDAAITSYERAIALKPDAYAALDNLGSALNEQGRPSAAIAAFDRAIAVDPNAAAAYNNRGGALKDLGRIGDAIASFREALRCDPASNQAASNLLLTLHYDDADPEAIAAEHRAFGHRFADALRPAAPPSNAAPRGSRPLRVGYVSRDFRTHSVAFFVEAAIAHHDRSRVSVVLYADNPRKDAVTARLRAAADVFRDVVGMHDEQLAKLVHVDAVDVLIDLGGHTAHNRLLAFARRPAPVQMTWLGYPDTTGMAAMDHRITDAEADPPGMTERLHTERLIRLPGGAWCYRAPQGCPDPGPPPRVAARTVTFGSFNHFAKISPRSVALWADVLARVPGSRMLVKAATLADPEARRSLLDRFARHGVGADRLDLLAWEPSAVGHLATYQRVDIALDTTPYGGTTTTCEALWMGVPVVTLAGATHVARVGRSLLVRVGLGRLVASTPAEYADIAAGLAADVAGLAALRSALRARMLASPLCDGARLARELEDAYLEAASGPSASPATQGQP